VGIWSSGYQIEHKWEKGLPVAAKKMQCKPVHGIVPEMPKWMQVLTKTQVAWCCVSILSSFPVL
jgi:hypothetical protein